MKNTKNFLYSSSLFLISILAGSYDGVRPFIWALLLQNSSSYLPSTIPPLILFLGFESAGYLITVCRDYLSASFATRTSSCLRAKLTNNIANAKSADEILLSANRYVDSNRYDVDVIENFLFATLWPAITGMSFLAVNFCLNVTLPPSLAIAYLSALAMGLLFNFYAFKRLVSVTNERLIHESIFSKGAQLHYRKALQLIKGPQRNNWLHNRIFETKMLSKVRKNQYRAQLLYQYAAPLCMLSVFGITLFLNKLTIDLFSSGTIAAALSVTFLVGPLSQLFSFSAELTTTKTAWKRINEGTYQEPNEPHTVNHNYAEIILNNLKTRTSILVEGPSGSGKTSLAIATLDLLTKEYSKVSRKLFFLSESSFFEIESLENRFSEKSRLSNNNEENEINIRALLVRLFPNQEQDYLDRIYRLVIGQDGEPLSLGERQRVQLLLCLEQAPDFLILDEALSGCDLETELAILEYILKLPIDFLIINHRRECRHLFKVMRSNLLTIDLS